MAKHLSKNLEIINIVLMSVNGKIASHPHESTLARKKNNFTNEDDFERMRKLTSTCDVVFIGARSIESEKGAFRVAHLRQKNDEPEWIIFTRSGDISFQSSFWKQQGIKKSLFFVTSFDINEDPIFKVEEKIFDNLNKSNDEALNPMAIKCYLGNINGLIHFLLQKKYKKAALLGGGLLNCAFWEQNLVNKLYLTISPQMIGGEESPFFMNSQKQMSKNIMLINTYMKNNFIYLDYNV